MYSWISITIWTSDVKVCRDAELIFCNVEKDRVIVSFTYTFASKYTKTHVINWFLFFAYSTLTQTIFSVCQSHLHFWNSVSFIQQSVCEQKHETNFVYVTKNRDLSISLIIRLPKVCLTIRNTSKKHSNYQKGTNTIYNCLKCDHAPSIFKLLCSWKNPMFIISFRRAWSHN